MNPQLDDQTDLDDDLVLLDLSQADEDDDADLTEDEEDDTSDDNASASGNAPFELPADARERFEKLLADGNGAAAWRLWHNRHGGTAEAFERELAGREGTRLPADWQQQLTDGAKATKATSFDDDVAKKVRDLQVAAEAHRRHNQMTATAKPVDIRTIPPYEKPKWLVLHYLPEGQLVTLSGDEGVGKGLMSIWMSVQVLRQGRNVLWMSTEDSANELRGRLGWAGWNETGGIFYTVDSRMSIERLREFITDNDIALVVLDAGRDFMTPPERSQGNSNTDSTVRPPMLELAHLADETGATILFIHHTNKAKVDVNGKTMSHRQRIGGASAFLQVPRHNLMLEHNADNVLGFGIVKTNMWRKGHITECSLEAVGDGGRKFVPGDVLDSTITLDEWYGGEGEIVVAREPAEIDDMVVDDHGNFPRGDH